MSNYKISVIIPAINVEPYVAECLDSLLKQTERNFEVFLCVSPSEDRTMEICEEYACEHENFRIILPKKSGVCAARNEAIDLACGKYIYFLDADDYIPENAFERLLQLAAEYRTDVVSGNFYRIREWKLTCQPNDIDEFSEYMEKLLLPEQIVPFITVFGSLVNVVWNKLYLRDFLNRNNIRFSINTDFNEDTIFNTAVFLSANRVYLSKELLHFYRMRLNGATLSLDFFTNKRTFEAVSRCEILNLFSNTENPGCLRSHKLNVLKSVITWVSILFYNFNTKLFESMVILEQMDYQKNYIFWGASQAAIKYINRENRFENLIFVDRDVKKQQKSFHGYPVISPEQIAKYRKCDTQFIITSQYIIEIFYKLRQMGLIHELQDICWDHGKFRWMQESIRTVEIILQKIDSNDEWSDMLNNDILGFVRK